MAVPKHTVSHSSSLSITQPQSSSSGASEQKTILTRDKMRGKRNLNPVIVANHQKRTMAGFPGGAAVKNPPTNAGDTGSSPGPGRSHMPRSN